MAQRQHYLPQVYLRAWCENGPLLTYRIVGPRKRLERRHRHPQNFAFEEDLYHLPDGGVAHGLTANQLESALAAEVDARVDGIRARAAALTGDVSALPIRDELIWLMRTFSTRSPSTIRRVERGLTEFVQEQAPVLRRLEQRPH